MRAANGTILGALIFLSACDKKPSDTQGVATTVAAASAAPERAAAAPAANVGACPDGTWVIAGAAEQMQELLDRNGSHRIRVVGTSGTTEYTFTPTGPDTGTYKMDASGGKGLSLTTEADLGGQKQQTTAQVSGLVEGTYKKVGADQIALDAPTTRSVSAKASVILAGKTIEVPAFEVPTDAWHGTVKATCTAQGMTIVSTEGAKFWNGLKLARR